MPQGVVVPPVQATSQTAGRTAGQSLWKQIAAAADEEWALGFPCFSCATLQSSTVLGLLVVAAITGGVYFIYLTKEREHRKHSLEVVELRLFNGGIKSWRHQRWGEQRRRQEARAERGVSGGITGCHGCTREVGLSHKGFHTRRQGRWRRNPLTVLWNL